MIAALKIRFTKWYVAKGYRYGFQFDLFHMRSIYTCPLWVRPLLVFFSPSVYMRELVCKAIVKGLVADIQETESKLRKEKEDG